MSLCYDNHNSLVGGYQYFGNAYHTLDNTVYMWIVMRCVGTLGFQENIGGMLLIDIVYHEEFLE
jgi:hypothetical protein